MPSSSERVSSILSRKLVVSSSLTAVFTLSLYFKASLIFSGTSSTGTSLKSVSVFFTSSLLFSLSEFSVGFLLFELFNFFYF